MNEDTTIGAKPGDIWLTSGGLKAIIYATDGGGGEGPIIGAMMLENGSKIAWQWSSSGQTTRELVAGGTYALVSRYDWRAELAPIWAVLSPKYRWLAMDIDRCWWGYSSKPTANGRGCWDAGTTNNAVRLACLVFPAPPFPWNETLTERPD